MGTQTDIKLHIKEEYDKLLYELDNIKSKNEKLKNEFIKKKVIKFLFQMKVIIIKY
jgi:hypothetical protein